MKRKVLKICGIILGVLVLLIILAWPAAPLWAKLGFKPVCLQGYWPHVKLVSCSPQAAIEAVVTPLPLPTLSGKPIPIIVDDDGSPDGVIALMFFLRNPLFEVRAVTVSAGEAHPAIFAPHISQLLTSLGRADIPVGVGRDTPLEGNNAFPDPWRQVSDNFWGITYPEASASIEPVPAAELMVKTINNSAQPVMVFVSGTHTNLAEALRLDPTIAEHIRSVQIMGGSIYIPGNIKSDWTDIDNSVAEWNIWVDPVAAEEVFTSGLPLHLTPLDATNKINWTQSDALKWTNSGTPEGVMAGNLLKWMLDSWSSTVVYIWDLVAAINATNPALCPEVSLSVEILVAPGPEQGRTKISNQPANTTVCLEPDKEQMKALAASILGH